MSRRRAGTILWVVGLGLAALALRWAGRGSLAAPPLTDPGGWGAWLEARHPVVAAFGLVRVAALFALWYLAVATLVGAVLRMAGAVALVRIADRFTIAPVRRMLAGSLSLGLAASGVIAVAAPAVRNPVAAAQPATTSTTRAPSPATVTMHRLGPGEPPTAPAAVAPAPVPDAAATTAASTDRWTVKPGECFWSIAESVLTERWGRSPSDAEIVPYWRRLIDANRSELVAPDEPDLVLPGQVFVVPGP